jgi:hypothetical protein
MRYSEAFNALYGMSRSIQLGRNVKYQRVAIYVGRIMLIGGTTTNREIETWIKRYHQRNAGQRFVPPASHKDVMLSLLPRLTDKEWNKVRATMLSYAKNGHGWWKRERIEWVRILDTHRVFERL